VEEDDGIRSGITMATLAKLPTVFKKDGSTTPGNASQVFRTAKGPITNNF
jgi:acetyl-CoA acetyltransferase